MVSILRSVLAVFVGILAGVALVFVGEMIGHLAYPPPPGLDASKHEAIAEYMKVMPVGALASVLLSWAVATFGGAWVASRIAPRWKLGHGMIIGVFFLAVSVAIMLMIPHPAWAWVVAVVELPTAAYLGAWLAMPGPRSRKEVVPSSHDLSDGYHDAFPARPIG